MKFPLAAIKKVFGFTEAGILIVLILLCTIITFVNPIFMSGANIFNLLRTTSYVVIIASLTTIVMISGGLDLSVGSQMGLGGILVSTMMVHHVPILAAVVLTFGINSLIGLMNGLVVVKRKVPAMIATMGTLYIARGFCNVITRGSPVYPLPEIFGRLGNGSFLSISYSVYIAIAVALLCNYVLRNTTYGRSVYAIGGNQEAARLSGISVDRIKILAYIFSSISATLVGIIMTSRMESGQVTTGNGREMTIIAAVVIGGTSIQGGSGTILGTVIGGLLMAVVENSMVLMTVSVYWQSVVIGIIMIGAVMLDVLQKERAGLRV
jgi:ribose/xylose/arabinose/galactoside ABC-type transport system permease subunit